MKKINLIGWLLVALSGCDKAPLKPEWAGWGQVDATRNGRKWTNAAAAVLLIKASQSSTARDSIDLQFYKFSDDGSIRESLRLGTISTQATGRYQLVDETASNCGNRCAVASYQTNDDDVRLSAYSFDPGQPSYLEITAYDSITHRIAGKFQGSFNKQAAYRNNDPGTVIFENGTFSAPVTTKGRF